MKAVVNFLAVMILVSSPLVVYGQRDNSEDPVIKIFNKYEERDGVESITISPALLRLMKNGKSNDKKTQELISKISGLRILSLTDGEGGRGRANRESLTAELQSVVKKDFEEIMMVRSSGERMELYSQNKDGKGALLFITSSSNSVTVMHLAGTIDKTLIDAVMNGEIGLSK